MPKVYIPTLYTSRNKCAYGDSEYIHCEKFVDLLCCFLKANSIDYMVGKAKTIDDAASECNEYDPDICYSPHTAWSMRHDSRFSALYVFSAQPTSVAFRASDRIRRRREEIYPRSVFINQNREDPEILATKIPTIIDYIVFHDNEEEALFFHNNMVEMAAAVAFGFCDYFGLIFIDPKNIPRSISEAESAGKLSMLLYELKDLILRYSQE